LNEQIILLVDLQKIDSELDRITVRKKELPEKKAALEEGLKQACVKFDNERKRLDEAVQNHKQKEDNLKRGIENLKRTKERLLEVKTNKEYQAMLKEIELIEKKNGECEDEIIFALEAIDTAKRELKDKEKELADYRQAYEGETNQIEKEIGTIDQDFESAIQKKESIQASIGKDLLKRYETIKARRNGRAVVPVWKGICDGCHMNLPPQMYIELQKTEELMQCPYCSRIIYWDKNYNE
jgi:predicted  nucleic acid-binding Zn-ribbon protein